MRYSDNKLEEVTKADPVTRLLHIQFDHLFKNKKRRRGNV